MEVQLTYFKTSGKFYTDGSYTSDKKFPFEVFEEVQKMKDEGKLPGLVEGATEFIIHIYPEDWYPALIPA